MKLRKKYGWAWIVYLLSIFPLVLFQKKSSRLLARSGIGLLALGFVLHTTGILLRWAIAGRAPVSDMYESLVFMSWGVVFIGLMLELIHGGKFFSLGAAIMGAISLMFAEFLPLDSAITTTTRTVRSARSNRTSDGRTRAITRVRSDA